METETQPPVKSNNTWIILLSITALLSLLVLGYFVYQNITLQKQLNTKTITTVPASPAPTSFFTVTGKPSPSPTPSIKTHTNTLRNYSFQYPTFMTMTSETTGATVKDLIASQDTKHNILIYSSPENETIFLEFNAKVTKESRITVAGQSVKKKEGIERISDTGSLIHVGPMVNNGNSYMIVFTSGSFPADPAALTIFSQILSSFAFLK